MALTSPSGDILDFHSRMFSLLRKRACMRMCSFHLYPAPVLPGLKAPGAQYKQNPSFTMSISNTCAGQSLRNEFHMGPPEPFRHRNSQLIFGRWWRQTGSNRRPEACKATALPTELCPQLAIVPGEAGFPASQTMVGLGRVELPTSRLSSARSNQLSYRP
jgi:hypothetical protein